MPDVLRQDVLDFGCGRIFIHHDVDLGCGLKMCIMPLDGNGRGNIPPLSETKPDETFNRHVEERGIRRYAATLASDVEERGNRAA